MAGIAMVGETPSLTQEFIEKCAREEFIEKCARLNSRTVPSLAPPPQAVQQHSKEGCPARVSS